MYLFGFIVIKCLEHSRSIEETTDFLLVDLIFGSILPFPQTLGVLTAGNCLLKVTSPWGQSASSDRSLLEIRVWRPFCGLSQVSRTISASESHGDWPTALLQVHGSSSSPSVLFLRPSLRSVGPKIPPLETSCVRISASECVSQRT